ncbi:hypothetical protein B5F77_10940 [Parabacteroides sp. An277]|nr:hypothetical protein B5F77_10940 [Parabacteroides sp. An277]
MQPGVRKNFSGSPQAAGSRKKFFRVFASYEKQEKNFLSCRKLRKAGKKFSELSQAAGSRKKFF